MNQELITKIVEGLLTLVVLVITGVLLPEVKRLIQSKSNSTFINSSIEELTTQADIAVNYVQQTMVDQLKKDKEWNTESQKEALAKAVEVVLANISQQTTTYLNENTDDIISTIKQYVESAIANNKK